MVAHMRRKQAAAHPTESQEQAALIAWWNHYAPTKGLDPRLLFAIPNGAMLAGDARLRAIRMAMLKRGGLRVGVPDMFLAVPKMLHGHTTFHGLFLELKRIGGKASPDQIAMATLLRRDYNVVIVEGCDEAMRAIKAYLAD